MIITLSVIIPAYNASKHIETCILSLCQQDIKASEYEIIVVNDGSIDDTEQKVKHLALTYPNIILVSQENMGNGAARNTGIKIAKGEYIYFLDSDDYIAKNTLDTVLRLLKTHNLDILGFLSKIVTTSSVTVSDSLSKKDLDINIMSGIDFIGTHNYEAEVWWYISKKDFMIKSGFKFYDRKFVQDSYLTPTLFSKAARTLFVNLDIHRYRKSGNSITQNKSADHLNQHFKDLSFAIKKLYKLRHKLINEGVHNTRAIQRLHIKQQRYVFIYIIRFIKSKLDLNLLKKNLLGFKTLEAYPLDKFMATSDYRSPLYLILTFLFNKPYFLYPISKIYRLIKK